MNVNGLFRISHFHSIVMLKACIVWLWCNHVFHSGVLLLLHTHTHTLLLFDTCFYYIKVPAVVALISSGVWFVKKSPGSRRDSPSSLHARATGPSYANPFITQHYFYLDILCSCLFVPPRQQGVTFFFLVVTIRPFMLMWLCLVQQCVVRYLATAGLNSVRQRGGICQGTTTGMWEITTGLQTDVGCVHLSFVVYFIVQKQVSRTHYRE